MRYTLSTLTVAGMGLLLAAGCASQQQQTTNQANTAEQAGYRTGPDSSSYSEKPIHNPNYQYDYGNGFAPQGGAQH